MRKNTIHKAVAYARFSSYLQREESIDAQLRAIHEYAGRNSFVIVHEYIDRAKSATTDNQPEFLRMIKDSANGDFDTIIVHKLDRFARNRYDSAHYKHQLRRNDVRLCSVVENLDDSPESIIMESVLEGMTEYHSKNLAREVEKGKRENALQARHVGGVPPLGYAVDRGTMKLVVNEFNFFPKISEELDAKKESLKPRSHELSFLHHPLDDDFGGERYKITITPFAVRFYMA